MSIVVLFIVRKTINTSRRQWTIRKNERRLRLNINRNWIVGFGFSDKVCPIEEKYLLSFTNPERISHAVGGFQFFWMFCSKSF